MARETGGRRASRPQREATQAVPWWRSPLAMASWGNLLWWAALPPLSWGPLAWLAPIPWVMLIRQRTLSGKRPYAALWLSRFVFWLVALYWLTLPHWATSFAWLALAFYLAFYFPAFIGLCRFASQVSRSRRSLSHPWCGPDSNWRVPTFSAAF